MGTEIFWNTFFQMIVAMALIIFGVLWLAGPYRSARSRRKLVGQIICFSLIGIILTTIWSFVTLSRFRPVESQIATLQAEFETVSEKYAAESHRRLMVASFPSGKIVREGDHQPSGPEPKMLGEKLEDIVLERDRILEKAGLHSFCDWRSQKYYRITPGDDKSSVIQYRVIAKLFWRGNPASATAGTNPKSTARTAD